jgi:pimeloyl-ACP methyl ester carboxylesterase
MTNVYIHGASATHESFNYIRQKIGRDNDVVVDYDSRNGFEQNLNDIKKLLENEEKIFFIAHSLGGIYSLHLADHFPNKVLGAVTLSTPYGGSREADVARMFLPNSQLMRDISPGSNPMTALTRMTVPKNWTNVVSTQGANPFITAPNDGVVTIDSMRALGHAMQLIDVDVNHYEVVLSPQVIKTIRNRIDRG